MATHMSLRLAWHDNGWNGHICKKPCENVYCIGQHSYPGNVISETRDLEFDMKNCGQPCSKIGGSPACALSINAFGKEETYAHVDTPSWWGEDDALPINIPIKPYTACTWCYEQMYDEKVKNYKGYDNNKRFQNSKKYFEQFEPGKSLIFYYSGLSNPFSEEDNENFVIVGMSRLKFIDDIYYYRNPTPEIQENYANGVVWQRPVTSCYPEEGFRIPYEKYMDNKEIMNKIVFKPENRTPFKYGTREVTNDDAISIVWKFIDIINVLIDIKDDTEDWNNRKEWLNSLLAELWKNRGPYPGFPNILSILELENLIPKYINASSIDDMKQIYKNVKKFFEGKENSISGFDIDEKKLKKIKRNFQLREDEEQILLLDILPRFELTKSQIEQIIGEKRKDVSITAELKDIIENPYIIFEQYVGLDIEDNITLDKIDKGILPSPDFGLEPLLDKNSGERLRAFCVDELKRIASHSFGEANEILTNINRRLSIMSQWMQENYKSKNFKVDRDILSEMLFLREDDSGNLYLYLKEVYEDERIIENTFRRLAELPDIQLKIPISKERFYQELVDENSYLMRDGKDEYIKILNGQCDKCMQIFTKPISILSGAAGTGKTTVIKAIIDNITRVHGIGASFLIMTPTGKASERVKKQTNKPSRTIHSFLAENGWINKNFTMKREGGRKQDNINTIIIDECSMIDLNIFATLVRAINWNSVQRLILVGDPNQLPPIGRGRVFFDLIEWMRKNYPSNIAVLKENIRQLDNRIKNNGTGILDLAQIYIQEEQNNNTENKVNKERILKKLQEGGKIDKDLSAYYWKDQDELKSLLKKVIIEDIERKTGQKIVEGKECDIWRKALTNDNNVVEPENIQIISPYRGEYYGTEEINRFLQSIFNGHWSKKQNIDGISLFDKVIQYRNRTKSDPAYAYSLTEKITKPMEIYNGEIGIVKPHGLDSKSFKWKKIERFQVVFSGDNRNNYWYNYGKSLWKDVNGKYIPEQKPDDNLELAYAISVHKSQGSEFDNVYIIIPNKDRHLLSMELLYTAITRAQSHLTILIQEDISTMAKMTRLEKSAVRRINSSIFEFKPLPKELLYFDMWYKEGRKLTTLTEYLVRSKSEVIIANMLFEEDIKFEYEKPLFAPDGTMYLPDFTVVFRGETYYWEHVGMLNNEKYKKHWQEKEIWYNKFFDGKLITTFESNNLTKDIKSIIEKYR